MSFTFLSFEFVANRKSRSHLANIEPGERELKMRDLFLEGKTLREVGALQNPPVSRERVRQLLKKYFGIIGKDGGRFLTVTPNKIHEEIQKEKKRREATIFRYAVHFKCGEIEFLEINGSHWTQTHRRTSPKIPASAYFQQKLSAKNRGIEWNITFPEWWKIWQDSGHWEQRGKGKGYCMSRIGDVGGYEVGNVEIKTIGQNFAESFYKHPYAARVKKAIENGKSFQRAATPKTHCKQGHEFVEGSFYTCKNNKIVCKACASETARKNYLKKKLSRRNPLDAIARLE